MAANAVSETVSTAISQWEQGGIEHWWAFLGFLSGFATNGSTLYDSFEALHPHVLAAEEAQSKQALLDGLYLVILATTSLSISGRLTPASVATFLQSLFHGLPSTSMDPNVTTSPLVASLEDAILDTMWSIDVEIDDVSLDNVGRDFERKSLVELLAALLVGRRFRPGESIY